MKLAGVVVLYNPDETVLENILSYVDKLDILYAVDNSDDKKEQIVSQLKRIDGICYVDNQGNQGIAHALNIGAKRAMKSGYDYILTMDQDSRASDNMIDILVKFIEKHGDLNLGIVSAYQKYPTDKTCYFLKEYEQLVGIMTSGNLLNLKAYRNAGKFKEKLFIDMVDHEYCLRLNVKGYKIIRVNSAILYHSLGETVRRKGYVKVIHNYIRMYYYTRNLLYIYNKYKHRFPEFLEEQKRIEIIRIRTNLLYGKHRLKQLLYLIHGVMDYKRNKFGKLE